MTREDLNTLLSAHKLLTQVAIFPQQNAEGIVQINEVLTRFTQLLQSEMDSVDQPEMDERTKLLEEMAEEGDE